MKIELEIKSCKDCPHVIKTDYISPDPWEAPAENWFCSKVKEEGEPKRIRGYIEWHETNKVPIPDWCPFKGKD